MTFRTRILGTACAAAVAAMFAGPAMAQFNGTLSGNYGHLSADGSSVSEWNIDGAGEYAFGSSGLAAQVNGGYTDFSGSGENLNEWNVNGDLFWLGSVGRLGADVGYTTINVGDKSGSINATNYGGFAEWYANGWLTAGFKGGGASFSSNASSGNGNGTGSYVGGELVAYPLHDLALNGTYDYINIEGGHEATWGVKAEWLVSPSFPVSVWGGWSDTDLSGNHTPSISTWMVGITLYTNGNGATTLEDRQRSGVVGWAAGVSPILNF